jgi:hypothetical protein
VKWFTREWHNGDLPYAEADSRPRVYAAYIDSISDRLPLPALVLARPRQPHQSVDDALLDRILVDERTRRVSLRLLNGDLQAGYGKLSIEFAEADLVAPSIDRLRTLLAATRTEFIRTEVELIEDRRRLEVRFLLWPEGELVIRCSDLTTEWQAIADDTRADHQNEVVHVAPQRQPRVEGAR